MLNLFLFLMGASLAQNAVLQRAPSSAQRILTFSGYEWTVKRSGGCVGPGPNVFSDATENVFVDKEGRLHLKITQRAGKWVCAEIVSKKSFGYGAYHFEIASPAQFDQQAVWGLFTWNDRDPAYSHREIDIEFGRWSLKKNPNAQYVIQPYTRPQNIVRFDVATDITESTHTFIWRPESIAFQSWKGHTETPIENDLLKTWTYRGKDLPKAGGENVRFNLWLFGGKPPIEGKDVEVIVERFVFSASQERK